MSNKVSFSLAQLEAINADKGNYLISAGAGSGKTAVLIERLVRLISEKKANIDELLVVTFTNKAAGELKERLKNKLIEKSRFDLASRVDASDITTFDGFALNILKKYGYLENINSNVTVLGDSIYYYELNKSINRVLQRYYQKGDQVFLDLISRILKKDDKPLVSLIKSFIKVIDLQIDGYKFLADLNDVVYTDTFFEKLLREHLKEIRETIYKMDDIPNYVTTEKVVTKMKEIVDAFDEIATLDYYIQVFDNVVSKITLSTRETKDEDDKDYINSFNQLKKQLKYLLSIGKRDFLYETLFREKKYLQLLISIYKEVITDISLFKDKFNTYTFADIARKAYQTAKRPDVKEILKNKYKFILIDEYQDTNDIQESFIDLFANDNLYCVGDIKQSIYGFRNANPEIFKAKYELYKKDPTKGKVIDLVDNYRSRKEVINMVNSVMSCIMTDELGGADYKAYHMINYGNKTYLDYQGDGQNYDFDVFTYEGKKGDTSIEANIIAQDIIKKINGKYQVFKKGKLRDVEFSDFTILFRNRNNYKTFKRVFASYNIPTFSDEEVQFDKSLVIMNLKSALKVISHLNNNNEDDDFIYVFVSFMRGYVNHYNDQKIYDLIRKDPLGYKNDGLYIKLKEIANNCKNKPLTYLVSTLLNEFPFTKKIVEIGDMNLNIQNLEGIINLIKTMESYQYSIDDLILYFETSDKDDSGIKIKEVKMVENSVTMMTVHASKGLEFSIVYYPNLTSGIDKKNFSTTPSLSSKYGLIMKNNLNLGNKPSEDNVHSKTINGYNNFKVEMSKTISEMIRLLYVALTRTKEKMIFIVPDNVKSKPYDAESMSFYDLLCSTSVFNEHKTQFEFENNLTLSSTSLDNTIDLKLEKFSMQKQIKEVKKFSKVIDSSKVIDQKILQIGTHFHQILEVIDFEVKDTSFIKDEKLKTIVDKVLKLDIFKNATKTNTYHEYAFNLNEATGVIDLFIIEPDKIKLIDFKLSNIDDPSYLEQVRNYTEVLKTKFNMKVEGYLVSILKGIYQKVGD